MAPLPLADTIPTIDFSPAYSGDAGARRALGAALDSAARTYGFFTLINHGIPQPVFGDVFTAARGFFALPEAEKLKTHQKRQNRGYIPLFDSYSGDGKPSGQAAFSVGAPFPPDDPDVLAGLPFHVPNRWPDDLPGFRPAVEACYASLLALGQDVLSVLTDPLGLPEDFFRVRSRRTYSNMRINYYPPHEDVAQAADFGIAPHMDEGLLTLLMQDTSGGLEVMGPRRHWIPLAPDTSAIIVNIGKLMTRWTDGRYKSALHRVINRSGHERMSIPLFLHPDYRTVINPADMPGARPGVTRFQPAVAGDQLVRAFSNRNKSWKETARAAAETSAEGQSANP